MLPRQIVDFLDRHDVAYEVLPHTQAYTAQAVAQMLRVKGSEFAKPVILKTADGRLVMAVVPAPRPVDLHAASAALGAKAELAAEDDFAGRFAGCEIGAEPPFGNLYGLPVYVDRSLREDDAIVFNGGNHREAIRMRYADFERLVKPAVAELSRAH
jgi:Ala-tRNA(Pro) deacylase